ncbi:cupredoxin family protein [Parapusillimonas sp. SGNA-6]|nr:cupredoxin family protein [Parapusillimonas sp. SGNA-6]
MKRTLFILALSALPGLVLASGDHAGEHGHAAHDEPGHAASSAHAPGVSVGRPGAAADVTRNIVVTMDDTMRFTPSRVQVHAGETVRFQIRNVGKLAHEMVIGSLEQLKAHAAEMRQTPDMQHAEPNMITLKPGQTGELIWTFDQVGTVDFACLIPGHLEAGMVGKVDVS